MTERATFAAEIEKLRELEGRVQDLSPELLTAYRAVEAIGTVLAESGPITVEQLTTSLIAALAIHIVKQPSMQRPVTIARLQLMVGLMLEMDV
jgi:hypothetical protein